MYLKLGKPLFTFLVIIFTFATFTGIGATHLFSPNKAFAGDMLAIDGADIANSTSDLDFDDPSYPSNPDEIAAHYDYASKTLKVLKAASLTAYFTGTFSQDLTVLLFNCSTGNAQECVSDNSLYTPACSEEVTLADGFKLTNNATLDVQSQNCLQPTADSNGVLDQQSCRGTIDPLYPDQTLQDGGNTVFVAGSATIDEGASIKAQTISLVYGSSSPMNVHGGIEVSCFIVVTNPSVLHVFPTGSILNSGPAAKPVFAGDGTLIIDSAATVADFVDELTPNGGKVIHGDGTNQGGSGSSGGGDSSGESTPSNLDPNAELANTGIQNISLAVLAFITLLSFGIVIDQKRNKKH